MRGKAKCSFTFRTVMGVRVLRLLRSISAQECTTSMHACGTAIRLRAPRETVWAPCDDWRIPSTSILRRGRGTVVFAGFELDERDGRVDESNSIGIICLPIATEQISGDSCLLVRDGDRLAVALVDGLGHGPFAAEAARCAIDVFAADPFTHAARHCATGARAHVEYARWSDGSGARRFVDSRTLSYAAVGNISTSLVGGGRSRSLMTQNGIVGGAFRGLKEMRYAVDDAGLLIMHSDGLKTRWKLSDHPGLSERHPMVIARGPLQGSFARSTDDVSVLVAQLKP